MAAPTLAPGLARKVKKAQECMNTKVEKGELADALRALSENYNENNANNRRLLRTTVENSLVALDSSFVNAARVFVEKMEATEEHFANLSRGYDTSSTTSDARESATSALLHRCDALASELAAVRRKSEVVAMFLQDYQLNSGDDETLREGDIEEAFFEALGRVRRVQRNCRALLHTHHQRAGLELLDAMASLQEAAFERLCKWVQLQCGALMEAEYNEAHPLLGNAVQALRSQPVLLRFCAEEAANARHTAVFQAFLVALTRGGPGGVPKPLEAHSSDPQRYVGDILGWVHQAIANEKELLESLFGESEGTRTLSAEVSTAEVPQDAEPVEVPALMDKVFEGICRPLRVRIEQVLLTSTSLILTFRILQLLAFYTTTLSALMGVDTALTGVLRAVRDQASNNFREQMKRRTDKLLRSVPSAPRDLSCAPEIIEFVDVLLQIVDEFKRSMNAGLPGDDAVQTFNALLEKVTAPLVEVCHRSAGTLPASDGPHSESPAGSPHTGGAAAAVLPRHASRMYLINCLLAVWSPLSLHRVCSVYAATLKTMIDTEVTDLANAEVARILRSCKVLELYEAVRANALEGAKSSTEHGLPPPALTAHKSDAVSAEMIETCPELSSFSVEHVVAGLQALFQHASNTDALPECVQLVMPRLRADVAKRVAAGLHEAYRLVYNSATDPTKGLKVPQGMLKGPEQAAALLGI